MTSQISSFILLLDEGFSKAAWHGPNLLGSLCGLTLPELLYRRRKDGHNIWELAVHGAYWKYAVRNRLIGLLKRLAKDKRRPLIRSAVRSG